MGDLELKFGLYLEMFVCDALGAQERHSQGASQPTRGVQCVLTPHYWALPMSVVADWLDKEAPPALPSG